MNVALPVLILTLATMPGFLLLFGTLRGTMRRSLLNLGHFTSWLIPSVIASVIVHSLLLLVLRVLTLPIPDGGVLIALATGNFGKDNRWLELAIQDLMTRAPVYALYFLVSTIGAYFAGVALHRAILAYDIRFRKRTLAFYNEWHYVLTPAHNREPYPPGSPNARLVEPDAIYLTTLVDIKDKGGVYLFKGLVQDYQYASNGDLDYVILEQTQRRPLHPAAPDGTGVGTTETAPAEHAAADPKGYYSIDGNRFVIRRSEMITLNFAPMYVVGNLLSREDLALLAEAAGLPSTGQTAGEPDAAAPTVANPSDQPHTD